MDLSDLDRFAADVGAVDPVAIAGLGTRGGTPTGVRSVTAPSGILRIEPEEMIVECGAATPVDELAAALAEHGQRVALPAGGTVGGALAVGHGRPDQLGRGPVRDTLLQARYVGADGVVVTAGGPTVKNVSGFDLCRLLVGSRGTLGFLATVILRTTPEPLASQWFTARGDPDEILAALYRPAAVWWDGTTTWALLEGHPDDLAALAAANALQPVDDPPALPTGGRWSIAPDTLGSLTGAFVAEVGIGIVHHSDPPPTRTIDPTVRRLNESIKQRFDPTGRLNPGVDVLAP